MARIRSSIAGSVLAIAYALSPNQVSAQQVSQITYPTSQSSVVCTQEQQRSLVSNPQALETVAQAAFTGCVKSTSVNDCRSVSNINDIRTGLTGKLLTMLTSAEYDPQHGTITLNLEAQGRKGFVQYQDVNPNAMTSVVNTTRLFCY